jgi:hypothetical protein
MVELLVLAAVSAESAAVAQRAPAKDSGAAIDPDPLRPAGVATGGDGDTEPFARIRRNA